MSGITNNDYDAVFCLSKENPKRDVVNLMFVHRLSFVLGNHLMCRVFRSHHPIDKESRAHDAICPFIGYSNTANLLLFPSIAALVRLV